MSLLSGKQLHAYIFEELPISSEVISRVHELASQEDQPELVNKQPIFQWSNGEVINEINTDMENILELNNSNDDSDSDLSISDSDNSNESNAPSDDSDISISNNDAPSDSDSDNEDIFTQEIENDEGDNDFFAEESAISVIQSPMLSEEEELHAKAELQLELEIQQLDRDTTDIDIMSASGENLSKYVKRKWQRVRKFRSVQTSVVSIRVHQWTTILSTRRHQKNQLHHPVNP